MSEIISSRKIHQVITRGARTVVNSILRQTVVNVVGSSSQGGGVTSVFGHVGDVVGTSTDYATIADMQAVNLLLAASLGTGIIPLLEFSSVVDRAIEYNATLDRLEFSPKNLKINSRDALGNPHIEFGPAVTPYTEPPRVLWDRTNEKIVATRGWKIVVPPEEPIPSIALEVSGGSFKALGTSVFADDLECEDLFVNAFNSAPIGHIYFGFSGIRTYGDFSFSGATGFVFNNAVQMLNLVATGAYFYNAAANYEDLTFGNYLGANKGFIRYDHTTNLFTCSRPFGVDTINERTAGAGVTVDGLLIKDGVIVWSGVDKTGSSLADLVTRAHGALTDIGTNTHAQIDTHLASTANPHSTTGDQVLPSQTSNSGKVLKTDGTNCSWVGLDDGYEIALDGAGAAITTGAKGFYICMFAMTITGWTMVADVSGSITIDVWKDTYANHPPVDADSIVTPAISAATKAQGSGLSIACAKGDIIRYNVDSAATITMVTLALTGVRSA